MIDREKQREYDHRYYVKHCLGNIAYYKKRRDYTRQYVLAHKADPRFLEKKRACNLKYIKAKKAVARLWLNAAKNRPCMDCGQSYPPWCMDFDHVRGKKKFTIGGRIGSPLNLDRLKTEAAKCEIVCANCHRTRTHNKRISRVEFPDND